MVAWESIEKAAGMYGEVKASLECVVYTLLLSYNLESWYCYRTGLNTMLWSRWKESFFGACLLTVSLLSCSLEVVRNSDILLAGFIWGGRITLKLCPWKLVFGCFLQPYGMLQWRNRLHRFLPHLFSSQLRLSFFSFYLLGQRKKIQMTHRQIKKNPLLETFLLIWAQSLLWCNLI